MTQLPPEVVRRFRDDWLALRVGTDRPVLIAVSGGADSTSLLLLARAVLGELVQAATVDHGLRAESAQEAAHAAALCRTLGIPHTTLQAGLTNGANLQARAREVRYALLIACADAIGARWVATGHHADDQLETMLMRLNRGSGVSGLAAIRAREGRIVRPLLGWRRHELASVVAGAGVGAVDDPSNRDDRFDRARLRKHLAEADWLDPLAAVTSAAALADAEVALVWAVDRLDPERITRLPGTARLDTRDLPAELRRRLVLRCLAHVDPAIAPRGEALTRLLAQLDAGERATLGAALVSPEGANWAFSEAPPRRGN